MRTGSHGSSRSPAKRSAPLWRIVGLLVTCVFFVAAHPAGASKAVDAAPLVDVRLYTLDCGRIDFKDLAVFSDTGEHDGASEVMPVTCFLIRHGDDWMLWDAGLGDEIADTPNGHKIVGLRFRVPTTLASQLVRLGLKPGDIGRIGLSHLHADHSGNIRMFPSATFLVSSREVAWASARSTPDGVQPDRIASLLRSRIQPVDGDLDVFGDGTVRMVSTPGHTPGHHSLLLQLPRSGSIILTGDVAHFRENYDHDLVPLGNVSRAETIASIERVRGLANHHHARVVIQHEANVFEQLPAFPKYLD